MESLDYVRVESAIRFLEESAATQPSLAEVAEHVGLSESHFQRLFRRWAGVSPKRFLQFLTVGSAKILLRDSASVLDTAFEVGLSGPGRLHDLFVAVEAVSPGEYKSFGRGLEIRHGFHETPFGEALAATSARGLLALHFVGAEGRDAELAALTKEWSEAVFAEDAAASASAVEAIFGGRTERCELRAVLRGTRFQIKVWEALLRIPAGALVSYGDVARAVGAPGASRAVGQAVGNNALAYLIPCHRVLRASGQLGGYRWGETRKRAIVAWEAARAAG